MQHLAGPERSLREGVWGLSCWGGGWDEGKLRKNQARALPVTLGFTFQRLGGWMT